MGKKANPRYVRPIEPASFHFEGEPVVVNPQQAFDENDPYVLAFPHLFKPLEPTRERPARETVEASSGRETTAR